MRTYNLSTGSVQYAFFKSRTDVQIFGGAFANGKTTALVIKALNLARDYPGCDGLLARETYPKLNDTLRKEFLAWCPPDWIRKKPTQEDNTCYLKNGSSIAFRYIAQRGKSREDGSTTSNLLSATYDFIGIDQAEDSGITRKDFDDLIGRLRGKTPYRPPQGVEPDSSMPLVGPGWMLLTLNPSNGWLYREIVKPYILYRDHGIRTEGLIVHPETKQPLVELFESDTYANATNLPPGYISKLEAIYRGQMRDRYLLGKWVAFEGLVYPEFSIERHVLTRQQVLEHLNDCLKRHVKVQVLEAYDFGITSPTCYGLAFVDDYNRVVLLDGFYEPELPYTEHPRRIAEVRNRYLGSLQIKAPILADPQIFRRSVIAGNTTGDRLSRLLETLGLSLRPAMNDMIPGIAKVTGYINGAAETPHTVTGQKPGPLLYVVDDLHWFQDEIFSYYWKKNPQGNNTDVPVDNNDHAMDMVKYLLSRLPDASKISIPKHLQTPQWMFWHEERAEA